MKPLTKKALRKLDVEIARIYREVGANITIPLLDIGKIFAAAHTAAANDDDMRAAIVRTIAEIRVS